MCRLLFLLSLAVTVLIAAPARAEINAGPVSICTADEGPERCRLLDARWTVDDGPEVTFQRVITVHGDPGPLVIRLAAMGSAQVRWNGVIIGHNGVPGDSAANEQPGRFRAVFAVPTELVRPGENTLSARMTSYHLWLPVRHPLHEFSVSAPGDMAAEELRAYAPALLVGGVLLFATVAFSLVYAIDRSQRGAFLLAGVAALATLQLAAEAARAFVPYPYPWQLARIVLIAALAAATAVLMARYAAWRFVPGRRNLVTLIASGAVGAALILGPSFDAKTLGCLVVAILAVCACAAVGARQRRPSAWVALCMAGAAGVLALAQGGGFLDSGYYLALALVFAALMVEQVRVLRGGITETSIGSTAFETTSQDVLRVSDGRRVYLLRLQDVVWLKAADDYCEVGLADGRVLLNGATLAATLASAPPGLVRIHRSHAVNRAHVTGAVTRPGGGRLIMLGAAGDAPVGRVYRAAAARLLDEPVADPQE